MTTGRPSEYNSEVAGLICQKIAEGFSVRQICALDELPAMSTVFKWLSQQPEFAEQYARAKEVLAETFADDIVTIADDSSDDVTGELNMPNGVAVQRAKLRIDARKWVISKLLPKKYGDKIQQEVSAPDGAPLGFRVEVVHVGK
jgi:hypothetical protein